ncbi:MAG: hypothetical protein IT428_22405 [Planctomycetaceae bacterium]|nr:hypothetical protein [Planctomycetaceae bacterium]
MLSTSRPSARPPRWQGKFLALLPALKSQLQYAFRQLEGDDYDEALQEAVVNVFVAFRRLVRQGRSDRIFPSALARFAAAQVRQGRQVATRQNVRDVLSRYSQRKKQYHVEPLERFDPRKGEWAEAIVADSRTPVLDQVCFRIDFSDWLTQLGPRNRRIALALARGESTLVAARKFRISPARVSQLRREFQESWREFQGELDRDSPLRTLVCC